MGEVVKNIVSNKDGMCWLSTSAHDPDGGHEMISPFFDDVKWGGMSLLVM